MPIEYNWQWRNDSSEIISAYAAIRITGSETLNNKALVLLGDKPDDTEDEPHAINGRYPVKAGKAGECFFPESALALIESTVNPAHGDTIGPEKDKDGLTDEGEGYVAIGDKDSDDQQLVYRPGGGGGGKLKLALLRSSASPVSFSSGRMSPGAAPATVYVKDGDTGDYIASDTVPAKNFFRTEIQVTTDRVCYLDNANRIIVVDCSEA